MLRQVSLRWGELTTVLGAIVVLALAGCQTPAPRIATRPVELPMPTTSDLPMPTISREDWACPPDVRVAHPDLYCVTHATYRKLGVRQKSRKTYGRECRAIIRANNWAATAPIDWGQFSRDAAQAAADAAANTDAEVPHGRR